MEVEFDLNKLPWGSLGISAVVLLLVAALVDRGTYKEITYKEFVAEYLSSGRVRAVFGAKKFQHQISTVHKFISSRYFGGI